MGRINEGRTIGQVCDGGRPKKGSHPTVSEIRLRPKEQEACESTGDCRGSECG